MRLMRLVELRSRRGTCQVFRRAKACPPGAGRRAWVGCIAGSGRGAHDVRRVGVRTVTSAPWQAWSAGARIWRLRQAWVMLCARATVRSWSGRAVRGRTTAGCRPGGRRPARSSRDSGDPGDSANRTARPRRSGRWASGFRQRWRSRPYPGRQGLHGDPGPTRPGSRGSRRRSAKLLSWRPPDPAPTWANISFFHNVPKHAEPA